MNTNHPASASSPDDTDAGPVWTRGLKKYGNYHEGIVERAELVLEMHKQDTITTFGQKSQGHHLHLVKST